MLMAAHTASLLLTHRSLKGHLNAHRDTGNRLRGGSCSQGQPVWHNHAHMILAGSDSFVHYLDLFTRQLTKWWLALINVRKEEVRETEKSQSLKLYFVRIIPLILS